MKLSAHQYLLAALAIGSASAFVLPRQGTAVRENELRPLEATLIENWELTQDGCVMGQTQGHPDMDDGEMISTSPLVNPRAATAASFVSTQSGSQYLLGTPRAVSMPQQQYQDERGMMVNGGMQQGMPMPYQLQQQQQQFYAPPPDQTGDDSSLTISRETFLAGGAIAAVAALAAGVNSFLGDSPSDFVPAQQTSAGMMATTGGSEFSKFTPGPVEPKNEVLTYREVGDLFELWNLALQTGNPDAVAMRYADGAVLLPTKSDIPRSDYAGIRDYFVHFLEKKPTGRILESYSK